MATETNWDSTMISLITKRKEMLVTKPSYFGKYLELFKKRFNDHCLATGKAATFKDYLVPSVVDEWRVSWCSMGLLCLLASLWCRIPLLHCSWAIACFWLLIDVSVTSIVFLNEFRFFQIRKKKNTANCADYKTSGLTFRWPRLIGRLWPWEKFASITMAPLQRWTLQEGMDSVRFSGSIPFTGT